MNARHLSKTANWGSTELLLGLGRTVMGGSIDLDVASSAFWNSRTVHAKNFYTKRDNALKKRWVGRRIWLNPPGDPSGMLVKAFWLKLVEHWLCGDIEQACYVGFSLEQLVSLQGIVDVDRARLIPNPLDYPSLMPLRRTAFLQQIGSRIVESTAPGHGNFFTWLPPVDMPIARQRGRFNATCKDHGALHFPLTYDETMRFAA